MSGHSKWSTIKHKKAKIDTQRGIAFQKFAREIIVAAKLGGANLSSKFRLRTAEEKTKAAGLPQDNIKRAIDKGAGSANSENFEELTYEGYAAGGVAVIIEVMTDNRNRTAGDVRSYFTKFNGNLGENGCVGWMFKQIGQIILSKEDNDYEKLFNEAINSGAEDFIEEDDCYKVITAIENFQIVDEALEKAGFKIIEASLARIAENNIEVTDLKTATNIIRLLNKLEEHDDVQNVYANFDISDEILEQIDE